MEVLLEIRDPVHGGIQVEGHEIPILDHALVQRLRNIRQLGFSDVSFPGATHTRYLHSVGTMHLAGRAFDAIAKNNGFRPTPAEFGRLRTLVRVAALLHDVGHPPLSHTTESALPKVGALCVPGYERDPERQAAHEDLTIKFILCGSLGDRIDESLADVALDRRMVAAVISPDVVCDSAAFACCGADTRPLLHQIVSSELDVDRMDYLVRDAHFTGVRYGMFDREWIISGLAAARVEDRWHLALDRRAVLAFEDFLLSRYHMFLAVYFHHRTIAFDYMLEQWFAAQRASFEVPLEAAAFADFDDHTLQMMLRSSDDPWAHRIIKRESYQMLRELHGEEYEKYHGAIDNALDQAGVTRVWIPSKGVVSKYYARGRGGGELSELYIRQKTAPGGPEVVPLHESTDLFHKYQQGYHLHRLYAPKEQVKKALKALG